MAATRFSTSRSPDMVSFAERMERVRADANRVAFEHTGLLLQTFRRGRDAGPARSGQWRRRPIMSACANWRAGRISK